MRRMKATSVVIAIALLAAAITPSATALEGEPGLAVSVGYLIVVAVHALHSVRTAGCLKTGTR